MNYIYDCQDNHAYRASFNRLTRLVFGFDLEEWYQRGCWGSWYTCHSLTVDGEIVANASVSKMDLVLNGRSIKAIQLGSVMTHPDYRNKGHSTILMNKVLETCEPGIELIFLFANHSVLDYYPKFGFAAAAESQFSLEVGPISAAKIPLRQLNLNRKEDWDLMMRMVESRKPVSQRFGVKNGSSIFAFHALYDFPENMYYSQEADAILVFKQKDDVLHLYDVVSARNVDLRELLDLISNEQTREVRFHFTPDQFTDQARKAPIDAKEDVLFVRPILDLKGLSFRVPVTAHT